METKDITDEQRLRTKIKGVNKTKAVSGMTRRCSRNRNLRYPCLLHFSSPSLMYLDKEEKRDPYIQSSGLYCDKSLDFGERVSTPDDFKSFVKWATVPRSKTVVETYGLGPGSLAPIANAGSVGTKGNPNTR